MGTGILICGLNGSGKSTLGKALAQKLHFYFIDNEDKKYRVSIKVNRNKLPFLRDGDKLLVKYDKEQEVINITDIED